MTEYSSACTSLQDYSVINRCASLSWWLTKHEGWRPVALQQYQSYRPRVVGSYEARIQKKERKRTWRWYFIIKESLQPLLVPGRTQQHTVCQCVPLLSRVTPHNHLLSAYKGSSEQLESSHSTCLQCVVKFFSQHAALCSCSKPFQTNSLCKIDSS